jgi:hypothetical protein
MSHFTTEKPNAMRRYSQYATKRKAATVAGRRHIINFEFRTIATR